MNAWIEFLDRALSYDSVTYIEVFSVELTNAQLRGLRDAIAALEAERDAARQKLALVQTAFEGIGIDLKDGDLRWGVKALDIFIKTQIDEITRLKNELHDAIGEYAALRFAAQELVSVVEMDDDYADVGTDEWVVLYNVQDTLRGEHQMPALVDAAVSAAGKGEG